VRRLLLVVALAALGGCDLSMDRQPKYGTEAAASLWPDHMEARPPPAGVVEVGANAAPSAPPPVTPELMARGAERFGIFCKPCHGATGEGDGAIVGRGFPSPPSYASGQVAGLSGQQIFDVITNGYGVMYPFGSRISPADRWAIVAYVRALQTADLARGWGAPAPGLHGRPEGGRPTNGGGA
jgi:mono/diheme cytochrome c family protein